MRINSFSLKFALLLIAQILVWTYFNFSQFLLVTVLPAMIMCIPVRRSSVFAMLIAFITGFVADFLAGGILGLTSFALVAVAFVRIPVLRLAFGHELFSRNSNITTANFGLMKMMMGLLMATLLFVLIYVWADGAGTRPFWFNATKVALSTIVSTFISIPVANFLSENSK